MAHITILKKYSNRRLYDTEQSKYVTLSGVRELIRNGRWVKIVDANTNQDVTAFILTQIVLEQARSQNSLLPGPLLHLIIQYGDNVLHDFFEKYLQQVIEAYLEYRKSVDEQFRNWLELGSELSKVTQDNIRNLTTLNPFIDSLGIKNKKTNQKKHDGQERS
jgi:polyhydroxyalkanoate synthesis repressor PhaR